mmetsp:Transcript_62973/g.169252  ORF Transcript_62973/g.169252 Transcript_62973/m.169252 type:complete len:248 (-) Transcript_62973:102-845(-)
MRRGALPLKAAAAPARRSVVVLTVLPHEDGTASNGCLRELPDGPSRILKRSVSHQAAALGAHRGAWLRNDVAMHHIACLPHVVFQLRPRDAVRQVAHEHASRPSAAATRAALGPRRHPRRVVVVPAAAEAASNRSARRRQAPPGELRRRPPARRRIAPGRRLRSGVRPAATPPSATAAGGLAILPDEDLPAPELSLGELPDRSLRLGGRRELDDAAALGAHGRAGVGEHVAMQHVAHLAHVVLQILP